MSGNGKHSRRADDLRVRDFDVVTPEAIRIPPDAPVEQLLLRMGNGTSPAYVYVIADDGVLIGSVSVAGAFAEFATMCGAAAYDDLVPAAVYQHTSRHVRDIMENDPSVVKADTPISELAALVQRERRSEIPVVDDLGRFVGVVIVRRFIRQYVSRKERLLSTQA